MAERSFNRRSFLKGATGALLARSLPVGAAIPFSLATTTPAKAWVQFVYLALAVLSFAGVFGKKSNGNALRFAAMDAKLNTVLDNQILILESIQSLNENLIQLERTGNAQHRDERYLDRLVEAEGVVKSLNVLADELDTFQDRKEWDQNFYERYKNLAFRTGALISGFESDLTHTQTDIKGITSIMYASTIAWLTIESLRKLGLMELGFPANVQRLGWLPHVYFDDMAKRTSNALSMLTDSRYIEAHTEQIQNADNALARAKRMSWGHYTDRIMSHEGKLETSLCFGAPEKWKPVPRYTDEPPLNNNMFPKIPIYPTFPIHTGIWVARGKIETETQRIAFPPAETIVDGVATTTQEEKLIILGYDFESLANVYWIKDRRGQVLKAAPPYDQFYTDAGHFIRNEFPVVSEAGKPDPTKECAPIPDSQTPKEFPESEFKKWMNELYIYSQATIFRLALEHTHVGLTDIVAAHDETIRAGLVPELQKIWVARQTQPAPAAPKLGG